MTYAEFLGAIQERALPQLQDYVHKPFSPEVKQHMLDVLRQVTAELVKEENFPHTPVWCVSQDANGHVDIFPVPIPVEVYSQKSKDLFSEDAPWRSKIHGVVNYNTCSKEVFEDILNECDILYRLAPCSMSIDTMDTWKITLNRVYNERFGNEAES